MKIKLIISLMLAQSIYHTYAQDNIKEFELTKFKIDSLIDIIVQNKQKNSFVELSIKNCDTTYLSRRHFGEPLFLYHNEWDSIFNKGMLDVVILNSEVIALHSREESKDEVKDKMILNMDNLKRTINKIEKTKEKNKSEIIVGFTIDKSKIKLALQENKSSIQELNDKINRYFNSPSENIRVDKIEKNNKIYRRAILLDESRKCEYSETLLVDEDIT